MQIIPFMPKSLSCFPSSSNLRVFFQIVFLFKIMQQCVYKLVLLKRFITVFLKLVSALARAVCLCQMFLRISTKILKIQDRQGFYLEKRREHDCKIMMILGFQFFIDIEPLSHVPPPFLRNSKRLS